MKTVDSRNQIWTERTENVVKVGFTKSFLDGLDQCWHIVPANMSRFREKAPLMVVETNDALISILSPITANFFQWNDKAQNFPDRLTEDDVVLEMRVGDAVRQEVPMEAPQVGGRRSAMFNPSAAMDFAPPTAPTPVSSDEFQEFHARVEEQMRRNTEALRRQATTAVPQQTTTRRTTRTF